MTIETKFDIGDEVWLLHDNKIVTSTIKCLSDLNNKLDDIIWDLHLTSSTNTFGFEATHSVSRRESQLFKTKEELIQSL